jgi:hypothetical protein
MSEQSSVPSDDTFQWREITPLLELACWFAVLLAPFLRWVNGPAVSSDQFVVQVSLVSLAIMGAISLRLYHWRSPVNSAIDDMRQ